MTQDIKTALKNILERNLKACNMQALSLKEVYNDAKPFAPFTGEDIGNIAKERRYIVDSLTLCFGRLQDMLGSKVFSTVLKLEAEQFVTMIDVLNKMEKMEMLNSVDEWQNIREARNGIFHEYNYDFALTANNINNIINYTPELLNTLARIESYVQNKFDIKL